LGYNKDNWKDFQSDILERAALYPAGAPIKSDYGVRYEQEIIFYGPKNNPRDVLVVWQMEDGVPKFITAYPDRRKQG
jgi:hypothetical protein